MGRCCDPGERGEARGGEGQVSAQVRVTSACRGRGWNYMPGPLRLFCSPGTVSRHFPCISSFPCPHHPEICADDDTGS